MALLERTSLRVGNDEYAALNRSFGLSTLRDRHARIRGSTLRLRFRGKGGRTEERTVVDRRLATVVRRCQELPGQELFQYEDEAGEVTPISSDDVNAYIRAAAGDPAFSAKDFRTWTATLHAFRALRAGPANPGAAPARSHSRLNDALRQTAEKLGNTLVVTRASYVHPGVIAGFETRAAEVGEGPDDHETLERPATREDELELLRLLRRADRAASAGRRSRAGGRPAARAKRRRA